MSKPRQRASTTDSVQTIPFTAGWLQHDITCHNGELTKSTTIAEAAGIAVVSVADIAGQHFDGEDAFRDNPKYSIFTKGTSFISHVTQIANNNNLCKTVSAATLKHSKSLGRVPNSAEGLLFIFQPKPHPIKAFLDRKSAEIARLEREKQELLQGILHCDPSRTLAYQFLRYNARCC